MSEFDSVLKLYYDYYSIEILHGVTAIILTYHPHHAKLQVLPIVLRVDLIQLRMLFDRFPCWELTNVEHVQYLVEIKMQSHIDVKSLRDGIYTCLVGKFSFGPSPTQKRTKYRLKNVDKSFFLFCYRFLWCHIWWRNRCNFKWPKPWRCDNIVPIFCCVPLRNKESDFNAVLQLAAVISSLLYLEISSVDIQM